MKKVNKGFLVIIALILGIALMLSPFEVMAGITVTANPTISISCATNGEYTSVGTYVKAVKSATGIKLLYKGDSKSATNNTNDIVYLVVFDKREYLRLDQQGRMEVMKIALELIDDSSMSTMSKNKFYNFLEEQDESTTSLVRQLSDDVDADFATAYSMFKPLSGVVGTILGIITLAIFVCLTLMIVIDLSYLVLPVVRAGLTPESSTSGDKPKFVSNEAWDAVKVVEGDSGSNGTKDVLVVYLKKKVFQFIMLGICILYLVSGEIYQAIGAILDTVRGIIG